MSLPGLTAGVDVLLQVHAVQGDVKYILKMWYALAYQILSEDNRCFLSAIANVYRVIAISNVRYR